MLWRGLFLFLCHCALVTSVYDIESLQRSCQVTGINQTTAEDCFVPNSVQSPNALRRQLRRSYNGPKGPSVTLPADTCCETTGGGMWGCDASNQCTRLMGGMLITHHQGGDDALGYHDSCGAMYFDVNDN
jgi:hypothetical protein